jgi:hypothetical protein
MIDSVLRFYYEAYKDACFIPRRFNDFRDSHVGYFGSSMPSTINYLGRIRKFLIEADKRDRKIMGLSGYIMKNYPFVSAQERATLNFVSRIEAQNKKALALVNTLLKEASIVNTMIKTSKFSPVLMKTISTRGEKTAIELASLLHMMEVEMLKVKAIIRRLIGFHGLHRVVRPT